MSKIHSSQIHHSYEASIGYGSSIIMIANEIRRSINGIKSYKKADLMTVGSIHALRMLCEGKPQHSSLYKAEVLEWKQVFMDWFERIKKQIPEELSLEFKQNLEQDFDILLAHSEDEPEWYWREDSLKRQISISIKDEATLNLYQKNAEKHFSKSGNSLHNYLEKCLDDLLKE
jgi:hypothetical protein